MTVAGHTELFSFGTPPGTLQQLLPAAARFCLDVSRFVQKELELDLRGKAILVGFSGGADSTALLLALRYLAPKLALGLTAAHLDHALRPSSAGEAVACARFCEALGIPFFSERVDVAALQLHGKEGLEETARNARYAFYARVMEAQDCDLLALGHHGNDLAEDVLMRLVRGTGWPALGGMAGYDPARSLIRPLLLTPRAAIEDFLRALELAWITDHSNADPVFLRNRIRSDLLPLFLAENPAFLTNTANLWRLARLDEALFAELLEHKTPGKELETAEPAHPARTAPPAFPETTQAESLPGQSQDVVVTSPEQLLSLPKALRLRLYKEKLAALGPGQARLERLFALDAAWLHNPEKTEHLFPGGKQALVRNKHIFWTLKKNGRNK